jgi:hypothetical protein|nr:MAG TPA: 4Fe-4S binding domain protein [Caudoviricetes sp.]
MIILAPKEPTKIPMPKTTPPKSAGCDGCKKCAGYCTNCNRRSAEPSGRGITLERAMEMLETEYKKAVTLDHVRKPLAYSLHEVWKIVDRKEKC